MIESNIDIKMPDITVLMRTVCLYISPSVCMSVHLSVYQSICLYISPSVCMSVHLSVYQSICLYISPSVCISVHLSVCHSICLYISPSVYLSTFAAISRQLLEVSTSNVIQMYILIRPCQLRLWLIPWLSDNLTYHF